MPFVVVATVHIASLAVGAVWLSGPTKVMLMPTLLLALLVLLPARRTETTLWAVLALLLSWGGDVLLGRPGDTGFIVGLGFFIVAHLAYLVLFLRPLGDHRIPRLAALYILWWAALLVLLAPHLGMLLVPVAVYGLVLGAAAAAALGSNRIVAVGALIFLLSDTILAFKLFYPGFLLWQQDAIIMLTYLAGQGLIIWGTVLHARANVAAASPHRERIPA